MRLPRIVLAFGVVSSLGAELAPAPLQAQCAPSELGASTGVPLQEFGWAVSLGDDVALVGAFGADALGAFGSAYVFRRAGTGWAEEARLVNDDPSSFSGFGQAVALDGDVALVGARFDEHAGAKSGAAHVFRRGAAGWVAEAKLVAADAAAGDEFGQALAVSGPFAVVGAAGAAAFSGAVYLFRDVGGGWGQTARWTSDDLEVGDVFGTAVALDGSLAVVGAPGEDQGGSGAGAVYVFRRNGATWTQEAKLLADDAAPGDVFGSSVAVHAGTVVVGAPGRTTGGTNGGAAYVFRHDGSAWIQEARLVAADTAPSDVFGHAVGVYGDRALIGAFGDESQAGAAYVFERAGATWSEKRKLTDDVPQRSEYFGFSVAIHGADVLVGSPDDRELGFAHGSATLTPLAVRGTEVVRLGTPPNPAALLAGTGGPPVIGGTWAPVVDHASFAPGATLDFLNVSASALQVPSPFGTLLCSLPGLGLFVTAAGTPFAVSIPGQCGLSGAAFCAQALSLTPGPLFELTNALDVTIGTF